MLHEFFLGVFKWVVARKTCACFEAFGFDSEGLEKMGFRGSESDVAKLKSWKEMKRKSEDKKKNYKDGSVEETGCWVKFSFRSCMPSRSKVESFMSGTSASYGKVNSFYVVFLGFCLSQWIFLCFIFVIFW